MESLNKQQLILLALLVSFVTSIATGIVTVSLMEQAPPGVTQTINRVVEKTIERVVTAPSQPASVITTKETLVVKADEAVIEAIEKNASHLVRIKELVGEGENKEEGFAGIGLLSSADGLIVSDFGVVFQKEDESGGLIPETYVGVFSDGARLPLSVVRLDKEAGLVAFRPAPRPEEKEAKKDNKKEKEAASAFTSATFGSAEPKLGQAVVAIGGVEGNAVFTGIISHVERASAPSQATTATGTPPTTATTTPVISLVAIRTDLERGEIVRGSVLLNLGAEVIGISAGGASREAGTFVPAQKISKFLDGIGAAEEEKKKTEAGVAAP